VVWVALLAGPGLGSSPSRATEDRLLVSVAISLEPAFREIVDAWRERHPRPGIDLNAGGSALLMQQIRRGAPVDLFVSASPDEVERLEGEGLLLPGSRRTIASNRLTIVVAAGREPPRDPAELSGAEWDRIAVGNPRTAPIGRYAERVLVATGCRDAVRSRLVLAENARQVLDYVLRGEVAAGIVYRTDALLFPDRLAHGPALDPGPAAPVYEAAIPRDSARRQSAVELLELIESDVGRRILSRHGFGEPPARGSGDERP
jgi:molybdate transport system substrate-binding protein